MVRPPPFSMYTIYNIYLGEEVGDEQLHLQLKFTSVRI